ncbi:MAG: FadR family transcriptional regulator, partial [Mesorhizobium sp.]
MASDMAINLKVERKPKLSETVVASIRKQLQA